MADRHQLPKGERHHRSPHDQRIQAARALTFGAPIMVAVTLGVGGFGIVWTVAAAAFAVVPGAAAWLWLRTNP